MNNNRLKLNDDKTHLLIMTTRQKQRILNIRKGTCTAVNTSIQNLAAPEENSVLFHTDQATKMRRKTRLESVLRL